MADSSLLKAAAVVLNLFVDDNQTILDSIGLGKRPRTEDEEELALLAIAATTKKSKSSTEEGIPRPAITFTDTDFKLHFRVSRSTVEALMKMLPPFVAAASGRPALMKSSPETVVLMSLWTLGHQESFHLVSERFGVGIGHSHRLFQNFCDQVYALRA